MPVLVKHNPSLSELSLDEKGRGSRMEAVAAAAAAREKDGEQR